MTQIRQTPVEQFNEYGKKINGYITEMQKNPIDEEDSLKTKLQKLHIIQKKMRSIQSDICCAYDLLPDGIITGEELAPSLEIEEMPNHVYRYHLLKPFPHRIKYDERTKSMMCWYERDRIAGEYAMAYTKFTSNHSFIPYEEPILACFVFSSNETYHLPDMDNIDVKPFIDTLISRILIPDDNSRHLSLLLMAKEQDGYGDIYVGKSQDLIPIIFPK